MSQRQAGPRKDEATGTWWFVVDLTPAGNGRRRQARRRGFPTRREAQQALDRLRVAAAEGTMVEPSRLTVAEYLSVWCDGLATVGRAQTTIVSYRRNLRLHVQPHLGGLKIQTLTPLHLDRLYTDLRTAGRRDGAGGLSARSVRYIHTILRRALEDARRKGLIIRNPADDASPPAAKAARAPEMRWWTPTELGQFLTATAHRDSAALWRVTAMTGMRRGEVCGLRWADVDLEVAQLRVQHQIVTADHALVFRDVPKSDNGRRLISLDATTVAVLRRHRATQAERRLATGLDWHENDLVFCGPAGSALHPEAVAKQFDRTVVRSGLPRIRFHDLRHSHCAHLIAAGRNPRVISRRLGHFSGVS